METHGKLQLCSKIHFFLRLEKIDGLFFFSVFSKVYCLNWISRHLHSSTPSCLGPSDLWKVWSLILVSFWVPFRTTVSCFLFFFPGFLFVSLVLLIIFIAYIYIHMYVRNELFGIPGSLLFLWLSHLNLLGWNLDQCVSKTIIGSQPKKWFPTLLIYMQKGIQTLNPTELHKLDKRTQQYILNSNST